MNLTTQDLLSIIGEQTCTIKVQAMTIQAQAARLKELEPKKEPELKVVDKPDGKQTGKISRTP